MKKILFFFGVALLLSSCMKDKKTTWDTQMLTPLVKSKLTVSDLLKSDDIIENPDSSLKLIYTTELFEMNTDSFVVLPDSSFEFGASLESLKLPNDTVEYFITLGEMVRSMNNPTFDTLIYTAQDSGTWQGTTFGTDLPLGGQTFDISMDDLFNELVLAEGTAEIIIENRLPFDLKNLAFQLGNAPQPTGDTIIEHTFPLIAKNSSESETISLNNKTVLANLVAELKNFTLGLVLVGNNTPIDTNDAIIAKIIVKDLKPTRATATWPDQNVIEETRLVPLASNIDVKLKNTIIRSGSVFFEIYSSLQDSIYISYSIPNLQRPGSNEPFIIDTIIPPAPTRNIGDPITFSGLANTYPMDGYEFAFNGYGIEDEVNTVVDYNENGLIDPDAINAYVTILKAKIEYTGVKKTLSLEDTVYVRAEIRDLRPEVAHGYIGKKSVNFGPSEIDFDLFNKIKSGNIDLQDVDFTIEVDNGIGAAAVARITNLTSENKFGDQLALTFKSGNDTMQIAAATELSEGSGSIHTHSSRTLTADTSNIDKFIENLPNKITYEVDVQLNNNVDESTITTAEIVSSPPNFIYHGDNIKASLNMEIPLSVITDSLVLVDTLDFSLQTEVGNEVESGTFKLLVDNGFPLDATTSIYFLDDNGVVLDSLWSNQTINRASVNLNGRVSSKTRTVVEFEISQAKMDIIKSATQINLVASFHTFDLSDSQKAFYKIYSHYDFKIKLVGDFKYQFSN